MVQLTKGDIQKISLYIPFGVEFAPMSMPGSITQRYRPCGQIGSLIIENYDQEENSVQDRSDISHPQNDDRPILHRLEDMTNQQYVNFVALIGPSSLEIPGDFLADYILDECSPSVFLYALSQKFDLFGLIEREQAIDYKIINQNCRSSTTDIFVVDDQGAISFETLFRKIKDLPTG